MITKQDLEKDTELTLENLAAQIQKRGFEAKIEKGFVSVPLENSSKDTKRPIKQTTKKLKF
jgi:hypothetical protein